MDCQKQVMHNVASSVPRALKFNILSLCYIQSFMNLRKAIQMFKQVNYSLKHVIYTSYGGPRCDIFFFFHAYCCIVLKYLEPLLPGVECVPQLEKVSLVTT